MNKGRLWTRGAGLAALSLAMIAIATGSRAHAQIVEVGNGGPGPVKAEHLTAELTTLAPQIAVGGTLQAGLVLTIEEHWHVYWINAGDSGEPPKITWTLPPGITAGPMQFPPPGRLPLGPLMDFGYEDGVAFPVLLKASPSMKPGKVHLDAKVTWLVCSSVCLPGKAHLGIDVDVVPGPLPTPPAVGALGSALATLPVPLPDQMSVSAIGDAKQILVTLKTGSHEEDVEFYPYDAEQIDNATDQRVESLPDGVKVWLQRSPDSTSLPKTLHGVVELSSTEAYDVTTTVTPGVVPAPPLAARQVADTSSGPDLNAFSAIGLAFLGGLLLNLMPCVFPVLFLKGLALVNSSNEERSRQRAHGLVYTLGIVVSFWMIVAALLILRAGGRELGWGFQLQSPGFVAVLAALVFFLGLSLAGALADERGRRTRKEAGAGREFLYGRAGDGGRDAVHGSVDGSSRGLCAGAGGVADVCGVYGAGRGARAAVSRAEHAAAVDAVSAAAGSVDGDAETLDCGATVCDRHLADMGVCAALYACGCRPHGLAAELLPGAGDCGMGAGTVARTVGLGGRRGVADCDRAGAAAAQTAGRDAAVATLYGGEL
jgi:DsbC/DsbD-like thiol-disulfide interchange protein